MAWRPPWWLDFLKHCWPLSAVAVRAASLPVVGKVVTALVQPWFGREHFNISYIPIHQNIDPGDSVVLSESIIAELIGRSAHRVIIKRCTCRDAGDCSDYPVEDGCLMLGEDTRAISADIARHVSKEEALAHLHRQVEMGLIPMTGRVRMDHLFYGASDRRKMLTICFCCPCCCVVLNNARHIPAEMRSSIVRLQGVAVAVDESACGLCGTCVQACFMKAISIREGRVFHDDALCIGCGRCVTVCPQKATHLTIEDSEAAAAEFLGRLSVRADVE